MLLFDISAMAQACTCCYIASEWPRCWDSGCWVIAWHSLYCCGSSVELVAVLIILLKGRDLLMLALVLVSVQLFKLSHSCCKLLIIMVRFVMELLPMLCVGLRRFWLVSVVA